MFPTQAEIKAVVAKDDPRNITGTFTLYDITAYFQRPISMKSDFPMVAALGQMAGKEGNETSDPYQVGQYVVVAFMDGDPNRPYIQGLWPWHDSTVAPDTADLPQTTFLRNGTKITIDKNGATDILLAAPGGSTQPFKIKDSGGTVIMEIIDPGAGYEVHLGGIAGLKRLMMEDTVAALSNVFTAAAVLAGDGGAVLKGNVATALNAAFTNTNSTTLTKAK